MPEGPEVETEHLQETIHEEAHKDGSGFVRAIALSTAVLAALAAIASLRAGGTVNEALVLKTEAARLQSEASDQWAYYQAKGVKAAVAEVSRAAYAAAGKAEPPAYEEKQRRYAEEQAEIKARAEEKEKERDAKDAEANHLLHGHHRFAMAVALFQVAIALGALAVLTRLKVVWFGSMIVGAVGLGMFALALLG
jgi:hypothetical protein